MFLLFSTLLLCVLCQVITADSYQNNLIPYEHNYYYPDYAFNYSSPVYSTRQKRIFDEDIDLGNINIVVLLLCFFFPISWRFSILEMSFRLSFTGLIPIDQLGTYIYLRMPFRFSLPSRAKSRSSYSGLSSGRSLEEEEGHDLPSRSELYHQLENYVSRWTVAFDWLTEKILTSDWLIGRMLTSDWLIEISLTSDWSRVTGVEDGHACILRAMCEISATPLHDDGLLGINIDHLLLSWCYKLPSCCVTSLDWSQTLTQQLCQQKQFYQCSGDAINFLLTGTFTAPDQSGVDPSYFEAQAEGQVTWWIF